jgi:hypothetical protein
MAQLSRDQVKDLIIRTQERYREIDHADWDGNRYRTHDTAKWEQAAHETAPAEWREIIRVLAQGESYYGGEY